MNKRPWTEGPWYTGSSFRHIHSNAEKNHPLQWWPSCDPESTEGPFAACTDECEVRDVCESEWNDSKGAVTSIAYVSNPHGCSKGDQVIGHPQVQANIDLICLAPEMAEAILALETIDYTHAESVTTAHQQLDVVRDKLKALIESSQHA